MLQLINVALGHADGTVLFSDINLVLAPTAKVALVGANGAGKSSLLRLLAGELHPTAGEVIASPRPFYVPQQPDRYDTQTVAAVLGVEAKLHALRQVLDGIDIEAALLVLDDDWTVEERVAAALGAWGLGGISADRRLHTLSGGQKTRVFLAAAELSGAETVLLDEPTNHLDREGRALVHAWVQRTPARLVVVSHDRELLNMLPETYELTRQRLRVYGGNYDFYAAAKATELAAFEDRLHHQEGELRKARQVARETAERRQKLEVRGEKSGAKAGLPKIVINNLRNAAGETSARLRGQHEEKVEGLRRERDELRAALPANDRMKLAFAGSELHRGKLLVEASALEYRVNDRPLWAPLDLTITSGERLSVEGPNGSGKTTLLRLLLGDIAPSGGTLRTAFSRPVYIDQHYSLLTGSDTVLGAAQRFNRRALGEHELRIRLDWFLFDARAIDKPVAALSGGERMRLALACLTIAEAAPDLLVLDEPTNNLDIASMEILTAAVRTYDGTLLVVSHDRVFLEEVGVTSCVELVAR